MIPLYVDSAVAPVRVVLDGPALRLLRPGTCDGRWPLQRLSRIVARGPVTWSGEALLACLAHGIPVSLLDGQGRHVGACLPTLVKHFDTTALLDDAAQAGVLHEVCANWRRAMERRAVLAALARFPVRPRNLRPGTVARTLLDRLDDLGAPLPAELLTGRLEALLDAELGAHLAHEGLGVRYQGGEGGTVNLRHELQCLLGWELWPLAWRLADYLARHGGKHRDEVALMRRIVRQFEGDRQRRAAAAARLMAELRQCLRAALA